MENVNLDGFELITGTIEKIIYKNENNGYTVCYVNTGSENITVVGIMPFLSDGDSAKFYGEYIVHSNYGRQFSVKYFEKEEPKTTAGILRILSSGLIKGVGPGTACKIVEKFGIDSLDIIQNHPEELAIIKGISKEKALSISEEYKKQSGLRDVMYLLSPYEISIEKCIKIFTYLKFDAVDKIKNNPYILCAPEINFSFETVERIAYDFGISENNEMRLAAGIEYILRRNLMNGHTCLPRNKLISVAIDLLQCDEYTLDSICDKMIEALTLRSKTVENVDYIMLPEYYSAEEYIAARLLAGNKFINNTVNIDELEIDYVENKLGMKFEKIQRDAIKSAFDSGVLILTGGPGTGKTTTLNAIIQLFERRDSSIFLAAPTGRAAQRITELTGREAKTIHRLLEVEWTSEEKQQFCRNERNPLECDVLIVDEASMIDSLLFEALLRAVRISTRIIIVGDTDQLPSVSAGNILNDILSSNKFSSVRLSKVFRQAQKSAIITNAHAIINDKPSDFSNKGDDFFIMHRHDLNDAVNTVLELCDERLPLAYGFDKLTDIQVLCPSRKGDLGTVNLNNLLQQTLNPNIDSTKQQISYKGVYYRVGDKVMQIKNNYDLGWVKDDGEQGIGVFNGDVGYITSIDKRIGTIAVRYEDKIATYFNDNMNELELAYAITVHKSQGSEFDCVIIPLLNVPFKLMYRNLLYTAITRAKKLLIVVGDEKIYNQMAENNRKTLRYTMLQEFINEIADS